MVEYTEYKLDNSKSYRIRRKEGWNGSITRYYRTITNLSRMLQDGRPMIVVIPSRNLSGEELEEYRIFFCQEAKRRKNNMVYFQGPVVVEES